MTTMSLELSDRLKTLANDLADFTPSGLYCDGNTVQRLAAMICDLHDLARDLECEVSRTRWNEAARKERKEYVGRVYAALQEPGSNVRLFPVIPRPFHDGSPRGAA